MAKARGDKYHIDRDNRDTGGQLQTIATFDDWKTAKAAFDAAEPAHPKETIWLWRQTGNGTDVTTLRCKEGAEVE